MRTAEPLLNGGIKLRVPVGWVEAIKSLHQMYQSLGSQEPTMDDMILAVKCRDAIQSLPTKYHTQLEILSMSIKYAAGECQAMSPLVYMGLPKSKVGPTELLEWHDRIAVLMEDKLACPTGSLKRKLCKVYPMSTPKQVRFFVEAMYFLNALQEGEDEIEVQDLPPN